MDLMDGLYPAACTQASHQQLMVIEYEDEPKIFEKDY
jgi:hypothetical protein